MPKRPYPRHRRRHNAILVAVLENPALKQNEIAKVTGYSPSQVSRIVCSPDFQELYDLFLFETALKIRSKSLAQAGDRG